MSSPSIVEPGVIAFPVTPFHDDLSLDLDGLRANLQVLCSHPFAAIVAAGGTGEMYSLACDEWQAVVETTVAEAAGRMPVIAGVGFHAARAARMARAAEEAGANGILALPPYYPNAPFEGLLDYYRAIGEATPLDLIIYSRDWAVFSAEQVQRLAGAIPTLAAWKDGQADLRKYLLIMNRVGERLYWIGGAGDDMVPGYYSLGIRTYTSSISNVAPGLALQLHERAAAGDADGLNRLMSDYVAPLYDFRGRGRGYEVSAMKRMMDLIGLRGGPVRPPLLDVREADRGDLENLVERWRGVM